jgi:hypothetical protein
MWGSEAQSRQTHLRATLRALGRTAGPRGETARGTPSGSAAARLRRAPGAGTPAPGGPFEDALRRQLQRFGPIACSRVVLQGTACLRQ